MRAVNSRFRLRRGHFVSPKIFVPRRVLIWNMSAIIRGDFFRENIQLASRNTRYSKYYSHQNKQYYNPSLMH